MSKVMTRLQAAAVDGRAHTIRHRQRALGQLHAALVSQTESLIEAIGSDSGQTPIESRVEVLLAIACVREHYTGLNLEAALKEEYAVARNEDNQNHRAPSGLICIRPCRRTLLYSVLAPLSAALAAGNCVALYLERDLTALNSLLQSLLKNSLDADMFGIIDRDEDLKSITQHFQVIQDGSVKSSESILGSPDGRVIAVVDRTANLDAAAKALVMARFTFGGDSVYAPDLVMVNEFVKKPFLEAVMKYTFQRQAADSPNKVAKSQKSGTTQLLSQYEKDAAARVVSAGSNGAIVELLNRQSQHFAIKLREKILQVHAIRSLDDAIDLANKSGETYLASHLFASFKAANYLSQFITSRSAFVNHIPAELLVGPAGPALFAVDSTHRYTTAMFQLPIPQFVSCSATSQLLVGCLMDTSSTSNDRAVQDWGTTVMAPVSADPQPPGGAVGFFEQGLITGGSIVLAPVAIGVASALLYGGRYALSHFDWQHMITRK